MTVQTGVPGVGYRSVPLGVAHVAVFVDQARLWAVDGGVEVGVLLDVEGRLHVFVDVDFVVLDVSGNYIHLVLLKL